MMKRLTSLILVSVILASCNSEIDKGKNDGEQTEDVNLETEAVSDIDEDYEDVLFFHPESELKKLALAGEEIIKAYYSKLDEESYGKVKGYLTTNAQTEIEDYVSVLDLEKDYEVVDIKHEFVQGEDAPTVKLLYTVTYKELVNGQASEEKINEFRIEAMGWKDKEGLGIATFQNKTHLDANSLFN